MSFTELYFYDTGRLHVNCECLTKCSSESEFTFDRRTSILSTFFLKKAASLPLLYVARLRGPFVKNY